MPRSCQMDACCVAGDAVVDDPVVIARSCGTYPMIAVIQNTAVVYEIIARISKVNTMPRVILDGNRRDIIPACRLKIDAVDSIVLDRAVPDAHIR